MQPNGAGTAIGSGRFVSTGDGDTDCFMQETLSGMGFNDDQGYGEGDRHTGGNALEEGHGSGTAIGHQREGGVVNTG